jgi:hypothetical protein
LEESVTVGMNIVDVLQCRSSDAAMQLIRKCSALHPANGCLVAGTKVQRHPGFRASASFGKFACAIRMLSFAMK